MSDQLDSNSTDYVVSAAKVALGAVPLVGPLLTELAGTVIPKQRLDRLVDYSRKLEMKIGSVDQDILRSKLHDENFTDLLEETVRQAAQAVTDERREYLASLLASGVTESHISAVESRHILRMLSEINDIEIIWLRFFSSPALQGDREFREKHAAVLQPISSSMSASPNERERRALQENYAEHLISLGLLTRPIRVDPRTGLPEFDRANGMWKTQGTQVTPFGKLLLRYVGLSGPSS